MNYVLTKVALANSLRFSIPNLSRLTAMQLTEAFFLEIMLALEEGEQIKFPGFGSFQKRRKKERFGRNPKTGIISVISSRNIVVFRVSPKLKAKLRIQRT